MTNKVRAPPNFKLDLILEVKKYPIIWAKGPKNKDFLDDAWKRVNKALKIAEGSPPFYPGYCKKQWSSLLMKYRSHIKRGKVLCSELVENLAFIKPQLKTYADDNKSFMNSVETAQKDAVSPDVVPDINEIPSEQAVSLAIIKYLSDCLSPASMTVFCDTLMQVICNMMPNVLSEILEYGRQQLLSPRNNRNLLEIDWSGLSIPEEICQEIWKRDTYERVRTSLNPISTEKQI